MVNTWIIYEVLKNVKLRHTHARERSENRSKKGQKNRYLSLRKIGTLYLLSHNIPY